MFFSTGDVELGYTNESGRKWVLWLSKSEKLWVAEGLMSSFITERAVIFLAL